MIALAALALLAGALTAAGPTPAQAQQASDATLLQELAERLLSYPFPGPGGVPVPVQLLPGALPADLPLTLPQPPGSMLIGSAVRPSFARSFVPLPLQSNGGPPAPTGEGIDIVLDAPGAPADILAFYKGAMAELGWSPPPASSQGPGGFLPSFQTGSNASFCQSADGPWLSVSAFPVSGGPTDVRIHVDTGNPGPCSSPVFPQPSGPLGFGVLPSLQAPPNVPVSPTGGGGGPGRFSSEALAVTDMSTADLEAFYAQELTASGWTQTDSRDDGSLSWSTWSVPPTMGVDDYQGFLMVRAGPGDGQRTLYLEVASPSTAMGGGISFSTATGTATATALPDTATPAPAPPGDAP